MTSMPSTQSFAQNAQSTLLAFLEERTKQSWKADTDLFAEGGLSSLFAMELVMHVEQTFAVSVSGDELKLANFRTVESMAAMVGRLRDATDD